MNRTEKADAVEWIGNVFDKNAVVVVVANKGLSVAEMSGLRNQLREQNANLRVVKNRLAKIAISSRDQKKLANLFEGPTAIIYSEDPVAPAKIVEKFAKDNDRLEIKGGAMGVEILNPAGVKALASMPSREELIAQIVQTIISPAANIASAIGAPGANIAGILKTIEDRAAA